MSLNLYIVLWGLTLMHLGQPPVFLFQEGKLAY